MGLQMPVTTVQIAFDASPTDPISGMVWTTISAVTKIETKRGRKHQPDGQGRVEASTASITAWNSDARFNTWNTASPFWHEGHGLTPMKPIRVRSRWAGVTYDRWFGYVLAFVNDWPDEGTAYVTLKCVDAFYLLGLRSMSSTLYESTVLADSPLAFWRMDDDPRSPILRDSSGHARDARHDSVRPGVAGALLNEADTAADFGMVSGQPARAVASDTSAAPSGTGAFSIEAWVRMPSTILFGQGQVWNVGLDVGGVLNVSDTTGQPSFDMTDGFGFWSATGGFSILDEKWHHIVATRASDGKTMRLYVDGNLQDTDVSGPVLDVDVLPFYMGADSFGTPLFKGQLDEVATYATELTGADVADHYAAAAGFVQQQSGARIAAALDKGGIPAANRTLATGNSVVQAPSSSLLQTTVLAHVEQVGVDTEAGLIHMGRNGSFVFRDRSYIFSNPTSITPQVILGDRPDLGEEPYWLDGTEVTTDADDLWNEVAVTRAGGATQVVRDQASIDDVGVRSLPISTLDATDAAAYDRANWALGHNVEVQPRVASVAVRPQSHPDVLFPVVLAADLWDCAMVNRLAPGSLIEGPGYFVWDSAEWGVTTRWGSEGVLLSQLSLIEGVDETITPDSLIAVWHLSPSDVRPYFVWGTATWGDSTRWAF